MTAGEALYGFFSGFGIPAYPNTEVPEDAVFPFLTYSMSMGAWGQTVSLTVQLWYHTQSEAEPTAKAMEIHDAIGLGGKQLGCDRGSIWLRMGNPWCLSLAQEDDKTVKLRQMNIDATWHTL